jgi:regulator of protease activity HflC (stomatin/prohibitin superfamily)
VLVQLVELKDIELPETMKRAMAREAEAEREKRAKIIAAEGEALSAGKLAEAADVMLDHPIALQLRNLQVLAEIAVERNSTIIFPAQFLDSVRTVSDFVEGERRYAPTLGTAQPAASWEAPGSPETPPESEASVEPGP